MPVSTFTPQGTEAPLLQTSTGVPQPPLLPQSWPSPSWPESLSPQHLRPPAGMRAQVCLPPAETAAAADRMLLLAAEHGGVAPVAHTSTGVVHSNSKPEPGQLAAEPTPSWP